METKELCLVGLIKSEIEMSALALHKEGSLLECAVELIRIFFSSLNIVLYYICLQRAKSHLFIYLVFITSVPIRTVSCMY